MVHKIGRQTVLQACNRLVVQRVAKVVLKIFIFRNPLCMVCNIILIYLKIFFCVYIQMKYVNTVLCFLLP